MSIGRPVRKLNAETARKIAAGEVIDRPNAIVRELMDNAIDSGATEITVEITGGGIDKIRVIDNGCGMTREDLAECAHPHCTSKIENETDLLKLSTLGFRGEALASIAAVARLSIISGGYKMRASITEDHIIEGVSETCGTIVMSEGLFENFPARRQFLKRPASEGIMCRQTFIEKSLPRPDLSFRLVIDGETKIDLHGGETRISRFVHAMSFRENEKLFYEINAQSGKSGAWENENDYRPDWNFSVVLGEPSVNRTNKKDIYIFVNGRRIQEYSLVQAVEYGGQGYFPNGTFPVAAVFVNINPKLVDFNIHPAKKEARFSDLSELHHALSTAVKNFYKNYTLQDLAANALNDENEAQPELSGFSRPQETNSYYSKSYTIPSHSSPRTSVADSFTTDSRSRFLGNSGTNYKNHDVLHFAENPTQNMQNVTQNTPKTIKFVENATQAFAKCNTNGYIPGTSISTGIFKFLGSALGTFLIAEKNNSLFIIDQHAAHERILFDKIMAEKPNKVPLIIPYILKTESKADDEYLESVKDKMFDAGFEITKTEDFTWEVNTTPDRWKGTEKDLCDAVLSKKVDPSDIIRSIAAMTACKAAVKDHYILDEITAGQIAEEALTLTDPHCPHGRPVYHELSREKLFELVKRT